MIPDRFRLIATSVEIVRLCGPAAAIWLGNALSAQSWSESEHKDSWWHSSRDDVERRTGLSHEMQETVRRKLKEIGILHERRGIRKRGAELATIWYYIDAPALTAVVDREYRSSIAGKDGDRTPVNPSNDLTSVATSVTTEELLRTESPKPTSEDFTLSQAVAKTPPRKGGRPPQVPVPLPDDFKPSPEHVKVAAANGVDVEACLKSLRAWAIGKVRADWNRQFAVFLTPDKWGRNHAKTTEVRKFTPIPKYDAEGNVIVSH